jgi:hypothetical protein
VLEPLGDTDEEVLVSDDNVVQRGRWTFLRANRSRCETRSRASELWLDGLPESQGIQNVREDEANFLRFEITRKNMRELAQLSDKYIIDSLRKDIRVRELYLTFSH